MRERECEGGKGKEGERVRESVRVRVCVRQRFLNITANQWAVFEKVKGQ